MGIVRKSLEDAAARGQIDEVRADALTDADIARFNAEDGFDPEDTLRGFRRVHSPAEIRARIGMSQEAFAEALRIPPATLRNWEQGRARLDPVAHAFFALVAEDPERALKVLGGIEFPSAEAGRVNRMMSEDDATFAQRMKVTPALEAPLPNEAERIRRIERGKSLDPVASNVRTGAHR